ncbi:hypothetical protein [Microbacterium yannicii]|uniref:hypothetical protein n=1 Tax=Microbacterium yannicii TaxID=671622 RepID=UPI0002ECC652|nr:hypothetical protein [Microbacterium yannicii]
MTVPEPGAAVEPRRDDTPTSSLLRAAIWVAIGALIAAAIVCVVWVLIGEQNGIVGRAFLTILLLVGFAGVAILDAHLAPRRPAWFALASMGTWVALLLIGAVMIWMPERYYWGGFSRFIQFLLIVLVLQLALLHLRLYMKAFQRHETSFTSVVAIATITLVVALAALLVIPLAFGEYLDLPDLYWRIVVAVAILAAVGTALIPLVNVLFAPKKPRAAVPGYGQPPAVPQAPHGYGMAAAAQPAAAQPAAPQPAPEAPAQATQELLPWPNYVDGATPLPMLPDGSPDWNAYYTGYPSPGAHVFGASSTQSPPAAPQAPAPGDPAQSASAPEPSAGHGYDGYPPPPPLPPRE